MEEDKYITEYYRDRQRSYTCEISRYKDWGKTYISKELMNILEDQ